MTPWESGRTTRRAGKCSTAAPWGRPCCTCSSSATRGCTPDWLGRYSSYFPNCLWTLLRVKNILGLVLFTWPLRTTTASWCRTWWRQAPMFPRGPLVVCDKLDMFGYALRHPRRPASNGIANNSGLTPLTLACQLGRAEVFKEMLELSCREFWRYSNITCSAYPLNALDTLLPSGKTNWNSALFIILNGTKEEHLDMLDGGIIQRLLEEKWKTFAQRQFLKRLLILAFHLFTMSMAIYLRPAERYTPLLGGTEVSDIMRYGFEIATIMNCVSYVVFQQGHEIKNQGLFSFLKQLSHDPAKLIFLISNLLILTCIPLRILGNKTGEESVLIFAVPGSWFLLMFFAGAIRLTGPFVTMIYSMIAGDMFTFGIIYTVMLLGFSQAFYFLYKGHPGVQTSLYSSYPSTWMALYQITLGDYTYAELAHVTYPALGKTIFIIFMILVPILLLNMLIAMMGNTYALVIERSEKEWMKQWAKIVVSLERAVNHEDLKKYLEEYSISLGKSTEDPIIETRGVMVIKSKSKTKAKQRKGALANWKRVGRVTIKELHKRNMTGEELNKIMWGRSDIATPVRHIPDDLEDGDIHLLPTDALASALDTMAFAADLPLPTNTSAATGPPVGIGAHKGSAPPLLMALGQQQMHDDAAHAGNPSSPDPLRDLVIHSDLSPEKAAALATQAAQAAATAALPVALGHSEAAAASLTAAPNPFSGMTTATFAFMAPTKMASQKKLSPHVSLDTSDSEGIEGPLLGRASRLRRVRSAARQRFFSAKTPKITRSDSIQSNDSIFSGDGFALWSSRLPAGVVNPTFASSPDEEAQPESRPRTAHNKVGPSVHRARAVRSAGGDPSRLQQISSWSTRDIASINTLLAWDQPPGSSSPPEQ
ncbi:uncharacterized protein LOC132197274 isoform X2 [Neocloeon triangulifer]|uniref:uncharacterized protein LOC132197274 isoform X2 n=1 Tax=Neocloeon triangulifer TaxID=2078957 RepID=UPI00286F0A8C|nr:uncharacterized protein LOC132197274 isoform X2 [Neocloeon triangulifer]